MGPSLLASHGKDSGCGGQGPPAEKPPGRRRFCSSTRPPPLGISSRPHRPLPGGALGAPQPAPGKWDSRGCPTQLAPPAPSFPGNSALGRAPGSGPNKRKNEHVSFLTRPTWQWRDQVTCVASVDPGSANQHAFTWSPGDSNKGHVSSPVSPHREAPPMPTPALGVPQDTPANRPVLYGPRRPGNHPAAQDVTYQGARDSTCEGARRSH